MTTVQSVLVIGSGASADDLADLFTRRGFSTRTLTPGAEPIPEGPDLVVVAVPAEVAVATTASAAIGFPGALVVTTASVSITEIGGRVDDPTRIAGLHLGHQGAEAAVVEIVSGELTTASALEALGVVVERLGKERVSVKDNPGFLVDWLFLPYLNDVVQAFDEGLATADDLDVAIKLGLGYRQGPFELLEKIGVEQHLAATTAAHRATHDPRFAPPALLRRMAIVHGRTAQAEDDQQKAGHQA